MMQGWLLWFALTAAFSLMGVGMASWQGGMDVGGEMGTAHIGVAFTDYHGSSITSTQPEDWSPPASATINRISDKELEIKINNAYPGLRVEFRYEVVNTGSLPVRLKDYSLNLPPVLSEYISSSPPEKIEVENSGAGYLYILATDEVEPDNTYTFSIQIVYEPDL